MSKIPLYQSSERLISDNPMVNRSVSAEGQAGRDLQGAGEALTQAHDTIRKAYDFQQAGTFKVGVMEDMDTLTIRAQSDGDNTGDLSSYESEMSRSKANRLKDVSNPALRNKLEIDFDLQAAQTRTQLTAIFRKNMVNKGLANLASTNEYFVNEYAKTGDASYIDNMNLNIDTYVKQGFLAADDAQKIKTKASTEAKFLKFQGDLNTNRKQAEENLKNGVYGFDAEYNLKADAKLKAVTQEMKLAQIENRGIGNELLATGQLTEGWIDEQVKLNKEDSLLGFPEKTGNELKKALYGSIKSNITSLSQADKKVAKYKKAIDEIFPVSDIDQLRAYDTVLDAYNSLPMSKDELKFLSDLVKTQKDIKWNTNPSKFRSLINTIKSVFGSSTTSQTAATNAVRSMMLKIQSGTDPTIAVREVTKDKIIQDHPGAVIDDKIPPTVYGKGGFDNVIPTSAQTKSAFIYSRTGGFKKEGDKDNATSIS